jgi:hypothetical protein
MRILAFCLIFFFANAEAYFASASIQDSRIQKKANHFYKPGGICGFSLEGGFFNEPQNIVDYKLSFELKRFGYSYSDGDESVSLWSVGIKPLTWSITYFNVMLEMYGSLAYVFTASNVDEDMEKDYLYHPLKASSYVYGYGYRLGYNINKHILVALKMDYQWVPNLEIDKYDGGFIGGWGLSVQWNLPW